VKPWHTGFLIEDSRFIELSQINNLSPNQASVNCPALQGGIAHLEVPLPLTGSRNHLSWAVEVVGETTLFVARSHAGGASQSFDIKCPMNISAYDSQATLYCCGSDIIPRWGMWRKFSDWSARLSNIRCSLDSRNITIVPKYAFLYFMGWQRIRLQIGRKAAAAEINTITSLLILPNDWSLYSDVYFLGPSISGDQILLYSPSDCLLCNGDTQITPWLPKLLLMSSGVCSRNRDLRRTMVCPLENDRFQGIRLGRSFRFFCVDVLHAHIRHG
jgi:hypothetical protein